MNKDEIKPTALEPTVFDLLLEKPQYNIFDGIDETIEAKIILAVKNNETNSPYFAAGLTAELKAAIHYAAVYGHLKFLKSLLSCYKEDYIVLNEILWRASERGHLEIIKLIIQNSTAMNPAILELEKVTHEAAINGFWTISSNGALKRSFENLKCLIDNGALTSLNKETLDKIIFDPNVYQNLEAIQILFEKVLIDQFSSDPGILNELFYHVCCGLEKPCLNVAQFLVDKAKSHHKNICLKSIFLENVQKSLSPLSADLDQYSDLKQFLAPAPNPSPRPTHPTCKLPTLPFVENIGQLTEASASGKTHSPDPDTSSRHTFS